eukprot:361497-Chlamydomonas_euryale.AAC.9
MENRGPTAQAPSPPSAYYAAPAGVLRQPCMQLLLRSSAQTTTPSGMALCSLSTEMASATLDCSASCSSKSISSSALSISSSMPVIFDDSSGCSLDTSGKRRSPIIVFCCSGDAAASIAAVSGWSALGATGSVAATAAAGGGGGAPMPRPPGIIMPRPPGPMPRAAPRPPRPWKPRGASGSWNMPPRPAPRPPRPPRPPPAPMGPIPYCPIGIIPGPMPRPPMRDSPGNGPGKKPGRCCGMPPGPAAKNGIGPPNGMPGPMGPGWRGAMAMRCAAACSSWARRTSRRCASATYSGLPWNMRPFISVTARAASSWLL